MLLPNEDVKDIPKKYRRALSSAKGAGSKTVTLPGPGEEKRAILETYTKEHSAEYQSQALIDLAFRMRKHISDFSQIKDVLIETSHPDTIAPVVDIRVGKITIDAEPVNPVAPDGETKVEINLFNNNSLGLDDYEVEFLSKTNKVIEKIEKISNLKKLLIFKPEVKNFNVNKKKFKKKKYYKKKTVKKN